jgi:hypothetical protein
VNRSFARRCRCTVGHLVVGPVNDAVASAEQIQRHNDLTPATGERHGETNMAAIDR